jgi:hypothetical protein
MFCGIPLALGQYNNTRNILDRVKMSITQNVSIFTRKISNLTQMPKHFLAVHEMLFPGLLLTVIGGGFYMSILVKVLG